MGKLVLAQSACHEPCLQWVEITEPFFNQIDSFNVLSGLGAHANHPAPSAMAPKSYPIVEGPQGQQQGVVIPVQHALTKNAPAAFDNLPALINNPVTAAENPPVPAENPPQANIPGPQVPGHLPADVLAVNDPVIKPAAGNVLAAGASPLTLQGPENRYRRRVRVEVQVCGHRAEPRPWDVGSHAVETRPEPSAAPDAGPRHHHELAVTSSDLGMGAP
ncbi:hypothetical protein FRC11_013241, partial [Ceratobasidium sp. 423]